MEKAGFLYLLHIPLIQENITKESALGHLGSAESATFGAKVSSAFRFARLLVRFTTTHFLFDTATFHKLAETTNGVLNRFFFTKCKFDHD